MRERNPTMQDSLAVLLEENVPMQTVLDVGVLTGTGPLIQMLPALHHHLFEPVDIHFEQIERNYRNIPHTLHHVALSNDVGTSFLALKSIHGTDQVTHSQVLDRRITEADMPGLISCNEIVRTTLDNLVRENGLRGPFLLKVDVDGHEIPILKGAENTLAECTVVIVEAPLNRTAVPQFLARSQFLLERGFVFLDIVDLAYYDGVLWQADLVFVRKDVAHQFNRLRPFEAEGFQFDRERWYPLG